MYRNRRFLTFSAVAVVLLTMGGASLANNSAPLNPQVVSPRVGSPIRKTLLNILRPAVEKELRQKVIFSVDTFRLYRGWAFITGEPLQPNHKRIDYSKTIYHEAWKYGGFSGNFCALLHHTAGKWKLVTYHLGATDVFWEDWPRRYHAPTALFKLNGITQ